MSTQHVSVPVSGMTCRSCEVLIAAELADIPGVREASASVARGRVDVRVDENFDASAAAAALAAHGYHWDQRSSWLSRDRSVWRDVVVAVLLVAAVAALVVLTGVSESLGSLTSQRVGWIMALVVGVAAGVSTCMATVGGLVLAASASYRERNPHATPRQWFALHASFHAGRLLSFAIGGALLGALGTAISLSGTGLAIAMIVAAVVMGVLGIRLSGVSPRIGQWTLTLPGRSPRPSPRWAGGAPTPQAAVMGAATFAIPCAFTQAMQVYALSTGDPAHAALLMTAFAVGTAPALIAVGGLPAMATGPVRDRVLRGAGVAMVVFAALTVSAALGTTSLGGPEQREYADVTDNVTVVDGVQYVTMTIDGYDYVPQHSAVYVGMPVVWEISGTSLTCASALDAPDLGIEWGTVILPGDPQTFTFELDSPGTREFGCSMDMYHGTITGIEPPS